MPTNLNLSLATSPSTAHKRAVTALILALSLALTSCSNGNAGTTSDPAAPADHAVTGDAEPILEPEPERESQPDAEAEPDAEADADAWILPDLENVCDGGSVATAPAYDRAEPGPHPIIVIDPSPETRPDEDPLRNVSEDGRILNRLPGELEGGWISSLADWPDGILDEWRAAFPGWIDWLDWDDAGDPSQAQLVACMERIEVQVAQVCEGYSVPLGTTSGRDIGDVQLHDVTYTVTLLEARTGQELDSMSFTVDSGACPTSASFEPGQNVIPLYGNPWNDLQDFVEPYVFP